jgi:hypothetical protein
MSTMFVVLGILSDPWWAAPLGALIGSFGALVVLGFLAWVIGKARDAS